VEVEDIRIHIESCWKWAVGSKVVRNGRGWTDQSDDTLRNPLEHQLKY
jgi:hypothetical protein